MASNRSMHTMRKWTFYKMTNKILSAVEFKVHAFHVEYHNINSK